MAADVYQLERWRDALERARFSGTREVERDGRRIRYGSDDELASAIAEVNRQIASLSRPAPVRTVYLSTSKGT